MPKSIIVQASGCHYDECRGANNLSLLLLHFLFKISEVSSEEIKRERDEKKRYLLRKLSFRPTVDDLKSRKVYFIVKI
jgi:hypothetical protein